MKIAHLPLIKSLLALILCISLPSYASSITDKLVVKLLNKSLPTVLYQHKDKPWQMGRYNLTIEKAANTRFNDSASTLTVIQPLNIKMNTRINKTLLGSTFTMHCKSEIVTEGVINVTPTLSDTITDVTVKIDIPLPDSYLNCEGLNVPITPLLLQLVNEKRPDWEQQVKTTIELKLKDIGF